MMNDAVDIKTLIRSTGLSDKEFSEKYSIPLPTVKTWVTGQRTPPEYVYKLINENVTMHKFISMLEKPSKNTEDRTAQTEEETMLLNMYRTASVNSRMYVSKALLLSDRNVIDDFGQILKMTERLNAVEKANGTAKNEW